MASNSLHSLTVLTEEDGVPGSKFEIEPEEYTVDQLKRWLKCRGLKLSGKREDLVQRVRDCVRSGNYHTLDLAIDHGKWFAAKVLQENSDVKTNSGSISIPCILSTGWRVFPSQNIPSLFNYGHVHYYALESIQNVADHPEDIEDGLGHMTDKPLKNGRKYVDSGFVHDMMDTVNGDHYLVRAHVWPSMRADLPHNVVVVLSVNSGAVLHASCDPCRASSLGRCSHVAVLFCILDHVQKHGTMLKTPCTSQECSWNKGKKRNKNPRRVSDATYPSKRPKQTLSVIEFDPRPARYREVNEQHINKFLRNIQALSQAEDTGVSMWETQLQFTYSDYALDCERKEVLLEQVKLLYNNLKLEALMEMPATQEQSKSERWFSERWCRLTASRCLGAFKVGKLVSESQPNAAIEANEFIANQIWGLGSDHFQTYWIRYGLESEPKAIVKYEIATKTRVSPTGFWVNPEFPFLGCSPDDLVGNDTVVEITALKIFTQYSVEKVTCKNSPLPKNVLGRQCFKAEDGKCVLKHTHAYYYQYQHIPLVTGRKYCDFILHAASGPDSVERIPRDEPLIKKILCFLTALWMLVIAPEVFEMRVPRNLLPFVLDEPSESLHSSKQSPLESPDCGVIPGDPTTCTSSFESVEQFAAPECTSPTATMDPVTPAACWSIYSLYFPLSRSLLIHGLGLGDKRI